VKKEVSPVVVAVIIVVVVAVVGFAGYKMFLGKPGGQPSTSLPSQEQMGQSMRQGSGGMRGGSGGAMSGGSGGGVSGGR